MQELPFLRSARRLMLIDICMKFREDSFMGFQVTERTRFVTDRRTDRRTDGQTPREKQYVSQPFGGRHNVVFSDAQGQLTPKSAAEFCPNSNSSKLL